MTGEINTPQSTIARYILRLYISGATPGSTRAIAYIKKICEVHLKERYDLQVIDIYQQPELMNGQRIVAVPTLIKSLPLPLRRLVGNLSKEEHVLAGLDIIPGAVESSEAHDAA